MKSVKNIILEILFGKKLFEIKKGYLHRLEITPFNDMNNEDEWQKEVYEYALMIFKKKNFQTVLDIGCGSAFKLLKYFGEFKTHGVEVNPFLNILKGKFPKKSWYSWNDKWLNEYDLLICSDVIEHVENPEVFIKNLNSKTIARYYVFSTPARTLLRGPLDFGPPRNPSHYREWSQAEFKRFLSKYYKIEESLVSNKEQGTQVVLCSKYNSNL